MAAVAAIQYIQGHVRVKGNGAILLRLDALKDFWLMAEHDMSQASECYHFVLGVWV